jgi:glucokinase
MTLGIDIGGTTINLGLVDGPRVLKKVQVPSFPKTATLDDTLIYLGDRIEDFLVPGIQKIGIGVPSLTDPVKGIVYNAANIPSWDVVPLKETLEARFDIPVYVNNDANCYALGAAVKVGGNPSTVVTVTLGTGTGVGIVIDGKLFSGTHCGAGEIGAIPYEGLDYESFCSKKYFTSRNLDPRALSAAAAAGDEAARAHFRDFGRHMGIFLSVVMYAYDADVIVLGGGIAHTFPHFQEAMWEALRCSYPYQTALDDLKIISMPDEDTAMVGAASLS